MKKEFLIVLIAFSIMLMLSGVSAKNGPGDPDSDSLGNSIETNVYGTDPEDWNSDNDELSDGLEIAIGSDPLFGVGYDADDDDYDGLGNIAESQYGTDINNWDTDYDGYSDGFEVASNMNPLVPNGNNGGIESDHDGLSDQLEILLGTNPNSWDGDGDRYGDDIELIANTDPNDPMSYPKSGGFPTGAAILVGPAQTTTIGIISLIAIIGIIAYALLVKKR